MLFKSLAIRWILAVHQIRRWNRSHRSWLTLQEECLLQWASEGSLSHGITQLLTTIHRLDSWTDAVVIVGRMRPGRSVKWHHHDLHISPYWWTFHPWRVQNQLWPLFTLSTFSSKSSLPGFCVWPLNSVYVSVEGRRYQQHSAAYPLIEPMKKRLPVSY